MGDPTDWFLTPTERGNPASRIDDAHPGRAWSVGNTVDVLIDGREYFARLASVVASAGLGDELYFTDLEGNTDEVLAGPGTELGRVFLDLARRGVTIRGLVWRAHPGPLNEAANADLATVVNEAGGEVLLDNRIRRGGSHHQKMVVLRRADAAAGDVAFLGGIDLANGRNDDADHLGDPQRALLAESDYGPTPPWHDVQLQLHGPAVDDIATTFRERWDDPSPLDIPSPWHAWQHLRTQHPRETSPLRCEPRVTTGDGPHAVQVLRTYPARRTGYPFAPDGERSVARAFAKAIDRARRLIYLEDQFLWSFDAAEAIAAALRRSPELRVICVIPRYPDPGGPILGRGSDVGRERVLRTLFAAGGNRVAVYDVENRDGVAIYVHAKVGIVDDEWMTVGSDNLNRRSWTHDSESSCAIVDTEPDPDGNTLAGSTRLRIASEHLERDDVEGIVEPVSWFDAFRESAQELDRWHRDGRRGPRPGGHLRVHVAEQVPRLSRPGFALVHRLVLDPDGRPRRLRRAGTY